jgi:hypothetical protein
VVTDSALVWIETADRRYVVAHLYRHPADDNRWHQAMTGSYRGGSPRKVLV